MGETQQRPFQLSFNSAQRGARVTYIPAPAGIAQVMVHEFAQAETFVQLAH